MAANSAPGVLAAVISAALTARWALARFRREKWWERKATTYTDILRALFLVKRYVDAWIENDDLSGVHTKDFSKSLLADWQVGARAVEEATVVGSFIISPMAASVLATLQKSKAAADPDDARDLAEHEAEALRIAIPAFVEAARQDLGVE